jgi:Ser/Thr protein kinase RdoA (MazF antagonist)
MAGELARLTAELAGAGGQVLHGDAGAGNLMRTAAGWVWHDFEDVCTGPLAWDLAPSAASRFMDRERFLAAYGTAVDARELDACCQLRRLNLVVWYSIYAERLPDCSERAAELAAAWQPA